MKPADPARHAPASGRPAGASHDQRRPAATARAFVLVPILDSSSRKDRGASVPRNVHERSPEARLAEAVGLARAIDLDIVGEGTVRIARPVPATLIGRGKVDEVGAIARAEEVDLVVVDFALTPAQQRNLERAWDTKVIDRTGLILEIFGARARTREGRLQVELAHLNWQKSRLVRSWTHLERQRGGFGFLGGPGETQIETDRRIIADRIRKIEKDLESVRRTRALHRKTRRRVPYPVIAIVGYTNAGKSTLFNRLTSASVRAEDLLFATLDPTLRALALPSGRAAILSDTVGFVSDIPTDLVAAFRATLEEVTEADLVMHVRDLAHPDTAAQADDVREVLRSLGMDTDDARHFIEVWNKIDLLDADARQGLKALAERSAPSERPIPLSAATGEGVPELLTAIDARLRREFASRSLVVDAADGAAMNWLHERCSVLARRPEADGTRIRFEVEVPRERVAEFDRRFGLSRRIEGVGTAGS